MSSNFVLSEVDQRGVGTITLNRPEQHNAFDDQIILHLTTLIKSMEQDPHVRIIILKSSSKNFSAGADLQWMKRMVHYTKAENIQDAKALANLMHTLYYCTKPTVAIIQGATIGGGVGLVACCQIALASDDATFCFSEVKLGIIPAVISPYIIHAIGKRSAKAYFLTAAPFDAHTALRLGLCFEVVPKATLESRAAEVIAALLQHGPMAQRAINDLVNELPSALLTEEILNLTAEKIAEVRISPEGQEGLSAFLEKRKPNWVKN